MMIVLWTLVTNTVHIFTADILHSENQSEKTPSEFFQFWCACIVLIMKV